jgi:DNA (cytosine-5)-methyltransferase 1
MTPAWSVEIDPQCRAVLRRHWPDVPHYEDVHDVGAHNLAPVDLICGGWPCQDLSVAGRRAGLIEGKRSSLFFEAMRIIKELQDAGVGPAFALFENVPGLLSSNGGNDFAVVLAELANLGAVDIAWRVMDSQFFGVAQRRRRVFIVADFRAERAAEILALSEGLYGHPAPSREAGEEVAGCIGAGANRTGGDRFGHGDLDTCGAYPVAFGWNKSASQTMRVDSATTDALQASETSNPAVGSTIPRRLTPTECERLQDWPDGHTAWGIGEGGKRVNMADGPRYRMAGNGVTASVV